jgi:DNA polymerase-3 subunit delta'
MPFQEIVGQERVVDRLRRSWRGGRLAQAYCFTGPAGVGKRTTALALAQAVECRAPLNAEAPDACGRCPACRKVAAGEHPDVTIVRPSDKTVITIEQIREVAARAALKPYEGTTKVWILDPADQMQEPAANALLKTLEEPLGRSLFVLVTSAVSALLPTIRSRCQEVRFEPLSEAALREILLHHGRAPEDAAAAAALAGGSAERALAVDPAAAQRIWEETVADWWAALASIPRLLEYAERVGKNRATLEAVLEVLGVALRDVAVLAAGIAPAAVPATRQAALDRVVAALPASRALRLHAAVGEAAVALGRNAQPRFVAERMLFRMRDATTGGT